MKVQDNKTRQKNIYENKFNSQKIDFDNFLIPPTDYLHERLFRRTKPEEGFRVLELGMGLGPFLFRAVRRYGFRGVGTDYVMNSLRTQQNSFGSALALVRCDAEHLPFKNGTFDIAAALSVIEHLTDFACAIGELHRVLKPGGKCLLEMPCRDFKYSLFGRFRSYSELKNAVWLRELKDTVGHDYERIPDRDDWRRMVGESGFCVTFFRANSILVDAWFMYYGFAWIRGAFSRMIRRRENRGMGPGSISQDFLPSKPEKKPKSGTKSYSMKRRAAGFLWYYGVMSVFRLMMVPEILLGKLPVGAGIYIIGRKAR